MTPARRSNVGVLLLCRAPGQLSGVPCLNRLRYRLPVIVSKPDPPLPADGGIEGGLLERETTSAGEEDEDKDEDEDAGFAKGKVSPVRQMTTTDP